MAEIKQLSSAVADQISAGEVIERPASVVKELVENSIDADSDQILVDIKNGGKDKIRVKDNGTGIKSNQLELAFSRYATSKIENINDIYSLRTLGFRGEALASIASVSKIEVLTKHKDEDSGQKMIIKGSNIKNKETAASPQGTDITVKDIFYNTPARFKYMKTTNTEFGHISSIITDEALAYPQVKFTLKHNQKQVLKTPGTGKLKDTIYAIYGADLTDSLIPLEFEDNYIQVSGYLAHPNFNRSSRIHEKFFINQRPVKNLTISYGIENGYGGLLPSQKYPVVFLNIKLNPILVDVNVHPAKKEVKFSRKNIIKNVITKGVKNKLQEIDSSSSFELSAEKSSSATKTKKQVSSPENETKPVEKSAETSGSKPAEDRQQKLIDKNNSSFSRSYTSDSSYSRVEEEKETKSKYKNKQETSENKDKKNKSSQLPVKKIVGQIHHSYIIVEVEEGMYIIDQHAASERIFYEKFLNKFNQGNIVSQPLLVPTQLDLTPSEMEIIKKYQSKLEKMGIVLENFGGSTLLIQEVPSIIRERSSKKVVQEMIDNLIQKGETLKRAEMIEESITYMSCRTAVKFGDKLELREMENLVKDLFAAENPYRCPHGRPTMINLEHQQLEKGLGRK